LGEFHGRRIRNHVSQLSTSECPGSISDSRQQNAVQQVAMLVQRLNTPSAIDGYEAVYVCGSTYMLHASNLMIKVIVTAMSLG